MASTTQVHLRLGVLGWPVRHSRSPAMHNAALRELGLSDWRYGFLPVAPELFQATVRALPAAGLRGANVTIPHKERALALADTATPRARAIGAANTLLFGEDGAIDADNTDAPALVEALPFPPAGCTVLVLGAGGSARAAIWALRDAGAREVRIWNRTPERARALARELGGLPVEQLTGADILVHCTASGLDGTDTFKSLPLTPDDLPRYRSVVDFVYTHSETALVAHARARALPVVNGLELLVRQGALSFERFTGRAAPLATMATAAGMR